MLYMKMILLLTLLALPMSIKSQSSLLINEFIANNLNWNFDEYGLLINEFIANNLNWNFDEYGDFDDWIEIYNASDKRIDITDFYFTDDIADLTKWRLPAGVDSEMTILPGDFLLLWADDESWQGARHLGFRLSSSGEFIALIDSNGTTIIDSITFGEQYANISFGRHPDSTDDWRYFDQPTPETENNQGFLGVVSGPQLSLSSGLYNGPQSAAPSVNDPEAEIRYTRDGSIPSQGSELFGTDILIDSSTVIRISAFKPDYIPSPPATGVYFIDEEFIMPVLSLVTDPLNLWDPSTGIYINYDKEGPLWERNIYQSYFRDELLAHEIPAGIRIQGNTSRFMDKKSFRTFYSNGYGSDRLEYNMFNNPQVNTFKNLVLRAGYDDDITMTQGTLLRDPLVSELWYELGELVSLGNFSILYINKDYWGIYNIRESINEYFIQDHTGFEDFDLIRYKNSRAELKYGTLDDWNALEDYFRNNDFTQDSVYEEVKKRIDMDQFINLQALIQYSEYHSWGRGVSAYKENINQGRWRWTIWDMDRCFTNSSWNGFTWINSSTTGLYWGNYMVHQLLKNENFRKSFISRIADHLNYYFLPEKVIGVIDSLTQIIQPEMNNEINRWNGSLSRWESNVQSLRDFAMFRPDIVRSQMMRFFNISKEHTLSVSTNTGNGVIELNSLHISSFPWQGKYYQDVPVTITAIPAADFRLKSWLPDSLPSDQTTITLNLMSDINVQAIFEHDTTKQIVINEINYNSSDSFNSDDWIELFNNGSAITDISGWTFQDENTAGYYYSFPQNTQMNPKSYLVLCKDSLLFRSVFPGIENFIGNFGAGDSGFGLNRDGERIQLYDNPGNLVDEVYYDDKLPWPEEADGQGFTLELMNPAKVNLTAEYWAASKNTGGTPGKINSTFSAIHDHREAAPVSFQLLQNYPNPFNPTTIIGYSLPSTTMVELTVYNTLGQKLQTLFNNKQKSGKYEVRFDAKNLSSGIYFYRLKTTKFSQIKKMILLR
jgi:hypothetical protein